MKKIFVAGHRGMVGSAICRQLQTQSDVEIITCARDELDLCDQRAVHEFMKSEKPDEVILAAAKVGGIHANNTYPAEFIYQNLQIQNNVINAAHQNDVQKLLFLGSSCIYPRAVEQPMKEDALLTDILEPTNEPYAIAKISGIKMCESYNRQYGRDYRSVMPTNLYGPGDNFHPQNSHVVPALIRRFHEAKLNDRAEVVVWGSGKPRRELLFVDDLAEASLLVHNLESQKIAASTLPMQSHINIGTGIDITIKELAEMIRELTGFAGKLTFDNNKPDGTPRKVLDVSVLKSLGYEPKTALKDGLYLTIEAYINEYNLKT
jgi:GDP-L-fucose synthase